MKRTNVFKSGLDSLSVIDHSELIIRKESDEITSKRDAATNEFKKGLKSSIAIAVLPRVFMYVGIVFLFYCVVYSIENQNLNIPFLVIGLVLMTVFLILTFKSKSKNVDITDKLDKIFKNINELSEAELNIPNDAKDVEVFAYLYDKNDDPNADPECYDNDSAKVFEEDGRLCFYYGGAIIGIEKQCIEQVVKINEPVSFSCWDEDRGDCTQYGVVKKEVKHNKTYTTDEYCVNEYYSIRFSYMDTPFEIIIPPYDIQPFLDILKITPTEE